MVDRQQIEAADQAIRSYVRRTPVVTLDDQVTLKLELMQHAGSFKARGAFTNLLLREIPEKGVVAASGGNHGAAVAYAAMTLGVPARIFVPRISSPAKVERIRSYGAELVIGGEFYGDALAASEEWLRQSGAVSVHAFDQEETLMGTGTLGKELEQQADLDTVLIGVGGGGLLAGAAAWYANRVKVIGVEPEGAPTLTRALEAGKPVDAPTGSVASDSLSPKRVGELVFPLVQSFVREVLLVTDDAIIQAQQNLWDRIRIVAEPGGAAAFAALVCGAYRPAPGERVGVVVSGGNTVAVDFARQSQKTGRS
jgi:threonine dehydratase